MTNMERLFTPKELADLAGCSPATIKREVRRGRLKGLRIGTGRLVRVPESAWREYLRRIAAEQQSEPKSMA